MDILKPFCVPFFDECDAAEQMDVLQRLQTASETVSSCELLEFLKDSAPHFTKDSLRRPVKQEVIQMLMKCCSLLFQDARHLASSYIGPLLGWLCNEKENIEVQTAIGECIHRLSEDVTSPVLSEEAQQTLMLFVQEQLQGFSGEVVLAACFDCIHVLSFDNSTFNQSEFWQTVIDTLHRIKESGDLPETTISEATRCYSQLLFHMREIEVKSPLRFQVRDTYVESPCTSRVLSTITNTVEAMRFSATKKPAAFSRTPFGKENSSQELFSPRRPRHHVSFELLVSPRASAPMTTGFDSSSIPFYTTFSLPQISPWGPPSQATTEPRFLVFEEETKAPSYPTSGMGDVPGDSSEAPLMATNLSSAEIQGNVDTEELAEETVSGARQSVNPDTGCQEPSPVAEKSSKRMRWAEQEEQTDETWASPSSHVSADLCENADDPDSPAAKLSFDGLQGSDSVGDRASHETQAAAVESLEHFDAKSADVSPPGELINADHLDAPLNVEGQSDSTLSPPPQSMPEGSIVDTSAQEDTVMGEAVSDIQVVTREQGLAFPTTRTPMVDTSETSLQGYPSLPCGVQSAPETPGPAPDTPRSMPQSLLLSGAGSGCMSPTLNVLSSPSFDLAGLSNDCHEGRMEMDTEYRLVQGQYLELEEQFNKLKQRHEELQAEYEEVVKRNESRKETISKLSRNEDWYQARIQELEEEANQQQRRYDALYSSASEKLAIAERQLNETDAAMKQAQKEASTVKVELEASYTQLKHVKEQLTVIEKKLDFTTVQLAQCKERTILAQTEAAKAKALFEERNQALQSAMKQLGKAEKELEDTKVQSETRITTLKAEVSLMKARLAERDAEIQMFQEKTRPAQQAELDSEKQAIKARLLQIIVNNGGNMPPQDQCLGAYVELIANILAQKTQETAELLGYCQQLLQQNEGSQ